MLSPAWLQHGSVGAVCVCVCEALGQAPTSQSLSSHRALRSGLQQLAERRGHSTEGQRRVLLERLHLCGLGTKQMLLFL